jgi:hypothetical protein
MKKKQMIRFAVICLPVLLFAGCHGASGKQPAAQLDEYRVIRSYPLEFMETFQMGGGWLKWLDGESHRPTHVFDDVEPVNGLITYDYQLHGLLPWMQFFYEWRFGDLDGDGQADFIFYSGARRQTAYRHDGSVLWEYDNPEAQCYKIRFDSPFPIADIDRDGEMEFICAREIDGKMKLCIVNGLRNVVEKSIDFPVFKGDHVMIRLADLSGKGKPTDLILNLIHRRVQAYNADLKLLWEVSEEGLQEKYPAKHKILGHTQAMKDIDGDGREEVFTGSVLLDDDGTVMWHAPQLKATLQDGHFDSNLIESLGFGKQPNLITSTGGYCFDAEGTLLWEAKTALPAGDSIRHGQTVRVGKLRKDIDGLQVVLYDNSTRVKDRLDYDRVLIYDNHGKLLWEHRTRTPFIQEGGFGLAIGDWDGDGLDDVFVNDIDEMRILNGYGKVIATLPTHMLYAYDLAGDSRAEIVAVNDIAPGMVVSILGHPSKDIDWNQKKTIGREIRDAVRY